VDLPAAIEKYWAQGVLAVGAVFTGVKWWADRRDKARQAVAASIAARAAAKIDLTRLAAEVSAEAIQTLRDELHRLTLEIEDLRAQFAAAQRDHIRMIADKDAEIALLRGRNRQLEATIAAHRRHMIAAGLELPAEPAFFELRDGELTPMGETQ
jgi:hypothetical protein